jgi:hypothetical protein
MTATNTFYVFITHSVGVCSSWLIDKLFTGGFGHEALEEGMGRTR